MRKIDVALALLFGGCNFDTSYHLFTSGDPLRVFVGELPANWAALDFDDSAWPVVNGPIQPMPVSPDGQPQPCHARCRFNLGPQYQDYRQLTLKVEDPGNFTALVNGTALAGPTPESPLKLDVPADLLRASDNLLALEYRPSQTTAPFQLYPELDGTPSPSNVPSINKGPFLTHPTQNSVAIVWETDRPAQSNAVVDGKRYDGGGDRHHQVKVDGLLPSHAYRYHVEIADGKKSEEAELTTAPESGKPIRFVVFGDNRTNGDIHRRLVAAVNQEGPDFIVNTGDMVGEASEAEWDKFFAIEYPLLVRTPLFAAIGNHEAVYGDQTGRFAEIFALGASARSSGRAYAGDYGDVHVTMLDSNTDLSAQAKWLDQDLAAAQSRGAKHLFVALHWGPFSSGNTARHGSNDDAKPIVPVARAHAVDALFAGHDHFYEHGVSQGLHYFVSGGGGAPLHAAGRINETQVSQSVNHYLVVDIAGDKAHLTAKDLTGATIDQVDLRM